jgi:membrane-bound metal-dependent hydrolase YbcI (DUF457 family)
MSWATHELENYFIVKHTKTKASFLFIALGAFAPDLLTKGFVYGFKIGNFGFRNSDPIKFHRGWPGAGFTHSILFGFLIAALILRFTRERGWALGFLIGHLAHVFTDINDTAGTMLMFPFSTVQVTTGMWKHAAYLGRYGDAAAYYSSLGGVWDTFWLCVVVIFARNTLTTRFFNDVVVPGDPRPWTWLQRRFGFDERALMAVYRGWFFYGACRIVSWSLYARFRSGQDLDLTWGGPRDIARRDLYTGSWARAATSVAFGTVLVAITGVLSWRFVLKRWWREGRDSPGVNRVGLLAVPDQGLGGGSNPGIGKPGTCE